MKLKQAIKENEDKQMAQLMKELSEIENENQQKKTYLINYSEK